MKKTLLLAAIFFSLNIASAKNEWAPSGDRIKTRWAAEVNPECPLPEYPRPQMVRSEWVNLNGLWDYAITEAGESFSSAQGKILVPFAVESSLSGVERHVGKEKALWYERTFTVPKAWKGRNVILHFGAVDWKADVWVNGVHVGTHTGGYTPFSFDITSAILKKGKQTLRVKVWDASDNGWQPRGKQVNVPQSIWYTPVTGIWQTVWLEPVEKSYIRSWYAVSDIKSGTLRFDVDVEGKLGSDEVRIEILEGGHNYEPGTSSKVISTAENGIARITSPRLWSPDDPFLYGVRISLVRDGKILDTVDGYTSLRRVAKGKYGIHQRFNCMTLNNKPTFNFGPLDQGWWPDGLYTAPTDEALRYDIERTKTWGFNMIRKHIKVEPARWYYWCDRIGIMVWQDMPCIGDHAPGQLATRDQEIAAAQKNFWKRGALGGTDCEVPQQWKDNYYKEWSEIIAATKGFQCIVMWVPFNEAWGQFDTRKVVEFTRSLDSTRLINESSGGNFEFCSDVIDSHSYPAPSWDAYDRSSINVIGEYGGIGYPIRGHLWKEDMNWGYGKVKESSEELLKEYRDFAEILKMYVTTGCASAVYTQTTDVEIEVNGLMTYDRDIIKVDELELREINRSIIEMVK